MTITRIINGTEMEFELNSQELYDAFCEQEHKWDVSYVDSNLRSPLPEDQVHAIAWEMRRQIDKYGLEMAYAFDEAISELGIYDDEEAAS